LNRQNGINIAAVETLKAVESDVCNAKPTLLNIGTYLP
jgi:hypothetical protein